jgi:pimeloyl-ACP methyl ester carboxylesterase
MSTSDMVDDLEKLRKYWGLGSMVVMGHSHGGAIALGYAIRYPMRVKKLVLVDSNIQDFNDPAMFEKQLEARQGDKRFEAAIVEAKDGSRPRTDEEFGAALKRMLPLYFHDPDTYMPQFLRTEPTPPSAWVANANGAADQKSMIKEDSLMNQVQADTLILVGRSDFVCPPAVAERIHRAIRRSRLKVFEKTGHFPWIEDSEGFFKEVTHFAEQGK